jgi:hypothetical protein
MALTFNKPTDAEHKTKLESELLYAGWKSGVVYIGLAAAFEVKTAFVGSGSPIEVTGKTKDGKKLDKVKGVIAGNSFKGELEIPDNIKEGDWAYFDVNISKCGLKGTADAVPVCPPIVVANMKWSAKQARRGDIVTLSADVQGVRDGTPVKLTIYEYDRDGVNDKIVELAATSKDQKISLDWKYEYFEDTNEIPTDEELKKYGKKYYPPEYFFTVTVEGHEYGAKQESGLLEFRDWIKMELHDEQGNPIPDEKFALVAADGSKINGSLDEKGYASLDPVAPGKYTLEFPNVSGSLSAWVGAAKVPAASTGKYCVFKVSLSLAVLEVTLGRGIPLYAWKTGAALAGPHWTGNKNPPVPACFTRSSTDVELDVRIGIDPPLRQGVSISLAAESLDHAIRLRMDHVFLSGSQQTLRSITIESGSLPDKVMLYEPVLQWSYSRDAGKSWNPFAQSGPHPIYQTLKKPLEKLPYDFGYQKIFAYLKQAYGSPSVNGGKDEGRIVTQIADGICRGISADLRYDPSHYIDAHPLKYYDQGRCLCMNNAILMRYLCRTLGIPADVVYVWGGRKSSEALFYYTKLGVRGSFRVLAPKHGDASQNPHFTYHAMTKAGAVVYDPSYGTANLIVLDETAPGASRQTGASWPPVELREVDRAAWTCPHDR